MEGTILIGVREHAEGYPVRLVIDEKSGRPAFCAENQCGFDCTLIDAHDLIEWIESNKGFLSPPNTKE